MARIRTIKPDFFLHEELAELSALHRLLFVGLWTLADRDGLLEDRPRRIKAALLPWENCDVDQLLTELAAAGFIVRYDADNGDACIAIPAFKKHQRPHPKEPLSGLQQPPEAACREKKRRASHDQQPIPSSPVGREGKEILDNGKESPAEPPDFVPPPIDSNRAMGATPLPVDAQADRRSEGRRQADLARDLQAIWNEYAPEELPRWRETSEKREKAAAARMRERPRAEVVDVVQRIGASAFCRGENERGWKADPDFLLRPDTAAKVLEGKYDDRAGWPKARAREDPDAGIIGAPAECCEVCRAPAQAQFWGRWLCYPHGTDAKADRARAP